MSRQCQITGKKTATGNNRPFSLKATRRTFRPNLFVKKMFNPLTGKIEKMKLSAKAIKTLKKWANETGHETEADKMAKIAAQVNVKKTTNAAKGRVHKEKLTPKQKKELAAAAAAELANNKPAALETEKKED